VLRERLFVSDLDGTLLLPDKSLGARTRRAIERLVAAGGRFTVATGRSAASASAALDGLALPLAAIVHNGAMISELDGGRVAHLEPLAGPVAGRLFSRALSAGLTPVAYALASDQAPDARQVRVLHGARPNPPTARYLASVSPHHGLAVDDGAALARMVPLSLILLDDHQQLVDFFERECAPLSGVTAYPGHSAYTPGLGVGEITAAGASKALAAAWLARGLGLDLDHVVAFGDNLNDLPLLLAAGEAYCPPDAPPEMLSKVAGRVAPTAEEGVAVHLERLLVCPGPKIGPRAP